MGGFEQILQDRQRIGAAIIEFAQIRQRLGDLPAERFLEQIQDAAAIGQAQHGADRLRIDRAFFMGDGLIEQRKPIAHRAFGGTRDERECAIFDAHLLLFGDAFQMGGQLRRFDAAQIEALTTREHRDRHFADFGCREDELHMFGRLFERLQQPVEGRRRQHVHFVDDVDLVARGCRGIAHAFDDLADIVDAGAGGRVHLLHIDMAAFGNGDAGLANTAGMDGGFFARAIGPDAVERARDDAGGGGFAHAAHAGQHEGMRDAARGKRV